LGEVKIGLQRLNFYIYIMKNEILNLADDLFLEDNSPKREAFIKEFESAVALMREEDFNQFYAFADIIMQKYS
jgi:hypothetical protein